MTARWFARPAVAALLLVACAGDDETTAEPAATSGTIAGSETTAPQPTTPVDGRPFIVESTSIQVVDDNRPTGPDGDVPEQPSRTLPLLVLAPDADGPFPIVVFSHGVTASGPAYEPFLERIAEAGYVVVAPTFPLSSGEGGQIGDYVNQPHDVYFALDAVLADERFRDRIDPDLVALAGHSLGAITTVGAAYNSCCTDPRVDAAVELSGVELPFPDGDYDDRPAVPLLLLHGEMDRTVNVSGSEQLFQSATGPATLVRFPEGGHSDILTGASGQVVTDSMVAWLDRWLLDDPRGFDALPEAVDVAGVATVESNDL